MFVGGSGHALLILRPEELGFLRFLKQAKVPLNEFAFSWTKIADIQPQVIFVGLKNVISIISMLYIIRNFNWYVFNIISRILKFIVVKQRSRRMMGE